MYNFSLSLGCFTVKKDKTVGSHRGFFDVRVNKA